MRRLQAFADVSFSDDEFEDRDSDAGEDRDNDECPVDSDAFVGDIKVVVEDGVLEFEDALDSYEEANEQGSERCHSEGSVLEFSAEEEESSRESYADEDPCWHGLYSEHVRDWCIFGYGEH